MRACLALSYVGVFQIVFEASKFDPAYLPSLPISLNVTEQVNMAADSRGNAGGGEARLKMCRSVLVTLQRAAEVVGEVRARALVWW